MVKVSNLQTNSSTIQFNIHSSPSKKKYSEKVYAIAKNFFDYLLRNQSAFAGALWSYLFIEVGMAAAELTFGEEYIDDMASCEKILCEHWKADSENQSQFPSIVPYLCTSNLTERLPSYSFGACMNDLCSYMNNIGKKFSPCITTFNPENIKIDLNISDIGIPYSNKYTAGLWNQLCPEKEGGFLDLKQENIYINNCMEKLCDHYALYKINLPLDQFIIQQCQNINMNRLVKTLTNLTSIIKESQEKAENNDNWMKANVAASLTAALGGITTSALTLIGTIISYRIAKVSSLAIETIPDLSLGLRNVMQSAVHTTNAIIGSSRLIENEVISMEILDTISQISDSMSYYSAFSIEASQISSPDMNIIRAHRESLVSAITGIHSRDLLGEGFLNPIPPLVSSVVSRIAAFIQAGIISAGALIGLGLGFGISSILQAIIGNKGSNEANTIIESGLGNEGSTDADPIIEFAIGNKGSKDASTIIESATYTTKEPYLFVTEDVDIEYFNQMIQSYLNDYMVHISEGSNIFIRQVLRLRDSLPYWQNALCIYDFPKKLACRLPNPNPNQLPKYIPFDELKNMFSENVMGLCYVLQEQLWCNWSKFLDIMSITRNISVDESNCLYDQFFLKIQEIVKGTYQIQLEGSKAGCYNETIMIRV